MKKLLHTIVVLLLVFVTPAVAHANSTLAPSATNAPAQKKSLLQRLFSRTPAPTAAPLPAAPRVTAKPRPPASAVVRRSPGQRSDPQRGSATAARSGASAAKKAQPSSPAPDVLAKAPAAAPISTEKIQSAYSRSSTLGSAMRQLWERLSGEAARPTEVEHRVLPNVRLTAYHKGDPNSAARKASVPGVPLRVATATQIGVAAGPTELIGSYAIVDDENGADRVYLIADTGTAVEKKTASGGKAPVIDLYAPGGEDWPSYQSVEIVQITGAAHILLQDPSRRDDFLERSVFNRALALAVRS